MAQININNKEVHVEQFMSDWALALMSQGVIVRLSISRWRAEARLTPEMLGLRFVDGDGLDFMHDYVRLGKQKLLPPAILKEIETLEGMARNNLAYYSFDTVWGRFVPFTAFDEWERLNKNIRNDFFEQARSLGRQYDVIVASVKEDYKKMAKDVWFRLYPDKGEPTLSFIDDFVSKIVAKIPSQIDIISTFKYDVTYFIIPMPSFVEENVARAEEIRRQSEMTQFSTDLEKQTKKRISEEYVQRKKELIDGFLESTVVNMRKYVSELCDVVLRSIGKQSSGDIKLSHVNKIKAMIKKVRFLNFYDDKEIDGLIKDLENEIDKIKGELNQDLIVVKLKEIVEVGKKEFTPKNFNPAISVLEP